MSVEISKRWSRAVQAVAAGSASSVEVGITVARYKLNARDRVRVEEAERRLRKLALVLHRLMLYTDAAHDELIDIIVEDNKRDASESAGGP